MATIKSCTDIEQSKKLSEILPLESADMRYAPFGDTHPWFLSNDLIEKDSTPCWSLASLLSVLPQGYSFGNKKNNGKYYICMTCVKHDVIEYDEPVDACYEMILKLHKLKML